MTAINDVASVTIGIQPVPQDQRRLSGFDLAVLWGDLGVGLLVLQAGALLVPGLGAGEALAATLVGSVIGVLLLSIAAYIAADAGVPTMVLTRAAVGLRGSALPTVLNVIQLLGWTSFEILVMAQFANAIVARLFGISAYPFWAFVFAAFCTAMALGGPLVVVRYWLEKFGVWAMLATTVALAALLFARSDVGALLATPGTGDLSFWLGVDIVVALPVSWFPLVADYNRFARSRSASFWGTFVGYLLANVSFFGLGLLFVLALKTDVGHLNEELVGFLGTSALFGLIALVIILADETDEGFANIYSTAVSTQNLIARFPQRVLVLAYGAIGFVLAVLLQNADYEWFLLLIGSFFVPLLGLVAADYFVIRRRQYDARELFARGGRYWYRGGVNLLAIGTWLLGFLLYTWIAPPTSLVGLSEWLGDALGAIGLPFPFPSPIGATIPSFALTFVVYAVAGRVAAGPASDSAPGA
ncbi:MAG TPA: cytosine permease [Candidatus Limnocylindria bacterium]|nr:cytosine permease [Candidatus Limnocylindria bacterium]